MVSIYRTKEQRTGTLASEYALVTINPNTIIVMVTVITANVSVLVTLVPCITNSPTSLQTQMVMDFAHTPGDGSWPWPAPTGPGSKNNGTGGYVSSTWADWTVLPAIDVVNDALYTGM
jgi:hypothetical protein